MLSLLSQDWVKWLEDSTLWITAGLEADQVSRSPASSQKKKKRAAPVEESVTVFFITDQLYIWLQLLQVTE